MLTSYIQTDAELEAAYAAMNQASYYELEAIREDAEAVHSVFGNAYLFQAEDEAFAEVAREATPVTEDGTVFETVKKAVKRTFLAHDAQAEADKMVREQAAREAEAAYVAAVQALASAPSSRAVPRLYNQAEDAFSAYLDAAGSSFITPHEAITDHRRLMPFVLNQLKGRFADWQRTFSGKVQRAQALLDVWQAKHA